MLCKESIVKWFQKLKGAKRIDIMCSLLNMCLPFELRFLGTCLEDLGKRDFQDLRDAENRANNSSELAELRCVSDKQTRSKLALYLSLLRSSNHVCSNVLYKILTNFDFDDILVNNSISGLNSDMLEELLLLYTMAVNHPAFTYEQKSVFGNILVKLQEEENRLQNVLLGKPSAQMVAPCTSPGDRQMESPGTHYTRNVCSNHCSGTSQGRVTSFSRDGPTSDGNKTQPSPLGVPVAPNSSTTSYMPLPFSLGSLNGSGLSCSLASAFQPSIPLAHPLALCMHTHMMGKMQDDMGYHAFYNPIIPIDGMRSSVDTNEFGVPPQECHSSPYLSPLASQQSSPYASPCQSSSPSRSGSPGWTQPSASDRAINAAKVATNGPSNVDKTYFQKVARKVVVNEKSASQATSQAAAVVKTSCCNSNVTKSHSNPELATSTPNSLQDKPCLSQGQTRNSVNGASALGKGERPDHSVLKEAIEKELLQYSEHLQSFEDDELKEMSDDKLREVGLTPSAILQLRKIMSKSSAGINGLRVPTSERREPARKKSDPSSSDVNSSLPDAKKFPMLGSQSDSKATGAISSNTSQTLGHRVASNVPDSVLMPPPLPPSAAMLVPTSIAPVSYHTHVLQSGQCNVTSEQRLATIVTNTVCHTCIASSSPSNAPSFPKCCSKGQGHHACHLHHPQLVQGQHPTAVLRNLPGYRMLPYNNGNLDSVKEKQHPEQVDARQSDSPAYLPTGGRYSTSSASDLSSPPASPGTTPPDTPSMHSTQDEAEDWDRDFAAKEDSENYVPSADNSSIPGDRDPRTLPVSQCPGSKSDGGSEPSASCSGDAKQHAEAGGQQSPQVPAQGSSSSQSMRPRIPTLHAARSKANLPGCPTTSPLLSFSRPGYSSNGLQGVGTMMVRGPNPSTVIIEGNQKTLPSCRRESNASNSGTSSSISSQSRSSPPVSKGNVTVTRTDSIASANRLEKVNSEERKVYVPLTGEVPVCIPCVQTCQAPATQPATVAGPSFAVPVSTQMSYTTVTYSVSQSNHGSGLPPPQYSNISHTQQQRNINSSEITLPSSTTPTNVPYSPAFLPPNPPHFPLRTGYPSFPAFLSSHNTSLASNSYISAIHPGFQFAAPGTLPNGMNPEMLYPGAAYHGPLMHVTPPTSQTPPISAAPPTFLPPPVVTYPGVYSAFNPPSHSKGKLTCFNCGGHNHRGSDCKDQTMEEITKRGQYRLDYAPYQKPGECSEN